MAKILMALCACAALGACNAYESDVDEQVGTATQAIKKKEWNMPEQAEGRAKQGKPKAQAGFKKPALRKATRDEVEELNGTYRTSGSREKVLGRIARAQAAGDSDAAAGMADILDKAIDKMPAGEQAQARQELDRQLGRSGGRP
ncbi:MAG TPA: hypothetical protein VJN18_15485 [Polyangiaceae bacterium]|nr:hypothetical protein [Polyangiaceae bacterium]